MHSAVLQISRGGGGGGVVGEAVVEPCFLSDPAGSPPTFGSNTPSGPEAVDEAVGESVDEAVGESVDEAVGESVDEAVGESVDEAGEAVAPGHKSDLFRFAVS